MLLVFFLVLSLSLSTRVRNTLTFLRFVGTPLFALPSSLLSTPVPRMSFVYGLLLVSRLWRLPLLRVVVIPLGVGILLPT